MTERSSSKPPVPVPELDAALATALRAAWSPTELEPATHERLLAAALEEEPASPSEDQALATALRAAWSPPELDDAVHERLLAAALDGPLAPPSEAEREQGARLAAALEGGLAHPDADLARALRAAARPAELSRDRNEVLVARALRRPARVTVLRLVPAIGLGLALAAGVALLLRGLSLPGPHGDVPLQGLAVSRSTGPLFREPFESGGSSARVDRIALARSRELRENRFAGWGLR